jgi:hypothetical protein
MSKKTRPFIRLHNVETDEVIDREMNDVEFAQYEANQIAQANQTAEAKAKAIAKAELLDRLGITADEAQLLIG